MKRLLLVLLALTMCVLPLSSCGGLTEKQEEALDLYDKYEDLIEAIEDEDYDDVMKEIEDLFPDEGNDGGKNDGNGNESDDSGSNSDSQNPGNGDNAGNGDDVADTEENPSDKYAWTADVIPGTWVYHDYNIESNAEFIVKDDGTVEILGETCEWTLGYVRDYEDPVTYFEVNVTKDGAPAYKVNYRYDDGGYWYSYLSVYDPASDSYTSDYQYAYNLDKMTVVELTPDNWYDYFDYVEYTEPSFNAFGELSSVSCAQRWVMKDEYAAAYNSKISNCAIEYSYIYGGYYVSVDTSTYEITINEVSYVNTERSSYITNLNWTTNSDGDASYYVYLNTIYISDFENNYTSIYTDIMVDRVAATLYFFN